MKRISLALFSLELRKLSNPDQIELFYRVSKNLSSQSQGKTGNIVNQSKLKTKPYRRRKARENVCEGGKLGVGFTSDWLKQMVFKPIAKLGNAKPYLM